MKFTANIEPIREVLKKLRSSKILEKEDEENLSVILLEAKEEDGGSLRIVSTNDASWCCFEIGKADFESCEGDLDKNWKVSSPGKAFIGGKIFIDMILSFPKGVCLNFDVKTNTAKAKDKGEYLNVKYKTPGGKSSSTDFLFCKVNYFDEEPVKDEREKIEVSASKFVDAVESVSFASGVQSQEEAEEQLFGCRVELFGSEVFTSATNRKRICCYGDLSKDGEPDHFFDPIARFLEPILSNLNRTSDVTVEVGKKTTLIKQDGQTYCVPNVSDASQYPNCRKILLSQKETSLARIKFDKADIKRCLKTISLAVGKRFGMEISLDTEAKTIGFSAKRIDEGGSVRALHEENEVLGDAEIELKGEDHVKESYLVSIEFFSDIIGRFPSDYIFVEFGDGSKPLLFEDDNANFSYLLCLLKKVQ